MSDKLLSFIRQASYIHLQFGFTSIASNPATPPPEGNKAGTERPIIEKYTIQYPVNLCNYSTIEFRLFRGTLKYNTFIATLQFVDMICDVAISMSQSELEELSWSEFVKRIEHTELIQYLKERRLYINDEVIVEEDM